MKTKKLLTVLLTTCLMPAAAVMADGPLPTDPRVVAGDITITQPSPTQLLLQQSGAAGIVDWGSFSIGAGNGVQFNNGTGATLNRVTGTDLSAIMGTLDATGSVYLVNQNGIVFGKTGVVNTGGTFVASTLDIGNGDFLAGGDNVFAGNSDGYVINLGRISALGGDVALMGRNVVNEGTITAPDGTVGLVAGREILMRDAALDDGMFSVRIGGSDSSVTESGAIRAAAAELRANGGNVYALAGNTRGTIAATAVAKVKGRIFLTAGDSGKVQVAKAVKAVGADGKGGKITVSAGTVDVSGLLDVTGTSGGEVRITSGLETVFTGEILAFGAGQVGTGGFVEVSGKHLTYDGTVNTGGGTVLIDPDNIEITDGSSTLTGATVFTSTQVATLLGSGNLILQTGRSDTEAGSIVVSSGISVFSPFALTLLAHGDILADASILIGDTTGGGLNLVAGWDGSTNTTAFDASVFDGADLASQTIFGNATGVLYIVNGARHFASGSIFVGDGNQATGVAIGTFSGDTNVYGNNLVLTGSGNSGSVYGYAQLGYNASGFGVGASLNSDITVRAVGDVSLTGGTTGNSAAQIGNIGLDAAEPSTAGLVNSTASILIEALGDLVVEGGLSVGSTYAMVGNGSLDNFSTFQMMGDRSGDITIGVLGEMSIGQAGDTTTAGWIGHATQAGTVSNANILLTAAAYDFTSGETVGSGGTGSLDISMVAQDLNGGNVTAIATDSSLGLSGNTGNIPCGCSFITTPNDLLIQASGDIILTGTFAFSNHGLGNVALAAGANFTNFAGSTGFGVMGGRWLVYSTRPDNNFGDLGVMDARFISYNTVYNPADPFGIALGGNGLIYAVQPVVEVADAGMTYGGTLTLPGLQMTVNGAVVDAVAFGLSLDGTFVDPAKVTVSGSGFINAGIYATALDASVSILVPGASRIAGVATDFGQLTVDQVVVTGAITGGPTKVYDGSNIANLTAANFLLTGFIPGEGATVTQTTGTYASTNANAFGTIGVVATLAVGDFAANSGTLLSNYILPTLVTGRGSITQASLTGSIIGTPTKVYDGTNAATLTAANFLLTGFVGGEGATVTQTVGTYASANASGSDLVTATLAAGDFTATGPTLLANYVLPTSVSGNGAITRATITGAIIGTPTKVYDGATAATLTAANFLLTGFVGGDGATVDQTVGTYASANASGTNVVTATLAAGDFIADSGTLLANYALPASLSGTGAITRTTISGTIIGTPTKVYDGTTVATLTAANFLLTGFVVGEGATVTQTVGTYASANVSAANQVTATLAAGDFTAGSGTLLANYFLPTSVTGNGAIAKATVSGTVTGSIIGTPTKVYDGTNAATLTAANFLLTGFVAGEGATVTQTVGTYASANASGVDLVTVTLAAGDFVADSGTSLSNYVLPTSAAGNGAITRATITGAVIGTPTKVYDGTTTATLTAADFLLTGFVAGEGATVTQTVGSYASANASGTVLVTAVLVAGDLAANSGTLLANYVLPATVTGNGIINRALITVAIVGLPTKAYDGSNLASLTAANFLLSGFAAGQGATIGQTRGVYSSVEIGPNTVTTTLAPSDYTANGATLLSNYILPANATGPGLIDNAPLPQPPIPETAGLETFDTTPLGAPAGPATGLELISTETTQRILDEINAGSAFCKALVNQEYVIDCLSDRLQAVADGLSAVGEYSEVRSALEDAAQKLHALALANASSDLARTIARVADMRSTRALTAISSAAMGAANAQAAAIIDGARLVLLRSSSGSERRSVAFTQVAAVVNSTKVLLRSS